MFQRVSYTRRADMNQTRRRSGQGILSRSFLHIPPYTRSTMPATRGGSITYCKPNVKPTPRIKPALTPMKTEAEFRARFPDAHIDTFFIGLINKVEDRYIGKRHHGHDDTKPPQCTPSSSNRDLIFDSFNCSQCVPLSPFFRIPSQNWWEQEQPARGPSTATINLVLRQVR